MSSMRSFKFTTWPSSIVAVRDGSIGVIYANPLLLLLLLLLLEEEEEEEEVVAAERPAQVTSSSPSSSSSSSKVPWSSPSSW